LRLLRAKPPPCDGMTFAVLLQPVNVAMPMHTHNAYRADRERFKSDSRKAMLLDERAKASVFAVIKS
jgi:hypothetical protein